MLEKLLIKIKSELGFVDALAQFYFLLHLYIFIECILGMEATAHGALLLTLFLTGYRASRKLRRIESSLKIFFCWPTSTICLTSTEKTPIAVSSS